MSHVTYANVCNIWRSCATCHVILLRMALLLCCLCRWIQKSNDKLQTGKVSEAKKMELEVARKKFSIMDQGINLHRMWVNKKSKEKSAHEFMSHWRVLDSFASTAPVVPVESKLLWEDYYDVQAALALTQHVYIIGHSYIACVT